MEESDVLNKDGASFEMMDHTTEMEWEGVD